METTESSKFHQGSEAPPSIRDNNLRGMSLPQKLNHQLSRTIQLDHVDVQVSPKPEPIFNEKEQYRPYPDYQLRYDGFDPPKGLRVKTPAVTKAMSENPDDFDLQHEYKDHLSWDNLPTSIFKLEHNYYDLLKTVAVPDLWDDQWLACFSPNDPTKKLRYFAFLPFRVPWKVDGLTLEFWHSLDPRLEPRDIRDRMILKAGSEFLELNALSMRRQRFREIIHGRPTSFSRNDPSGREVKELDWLTSEQILLNTSMTVHKGRLWIPRLQKARSPDTSPDDKRVHVMDYLDSGLPPAHFLTDVDEVPGKRMFLTINLRIRLQHVALTIGKGRSSLDWAKIGDENQPSSWRDRGGGYRGAGLDAIERENAKRKREDAKKPLRRAIEIDGLDIDEWLTEFRTVHGIADTTRGETVQTVSTPRARRPQRFRRNLDDTGLAGSALMSAGALSQSNGSADEDDTMQARKRQKPTPLVTDSQAGGQQHNPRKFAALEADKAVTAAGQQQRKTAPHFGSPVHRASARRPLPTPAAAAAVIPQQTTMYALTSAQRLARSQIRYPESKYDVLPPPWLPSHLRNNHLPGPQMINPSNRPEQNQPAQRRLPASPQAGPRAVQTSSLPAV